MGALEAVLALKANQQAQEQQRADNLTQGIQLFQQARQQATANKLAQLQVNAGLAEKGLKLNADGSFTRDASLMSPLESILQQGKVAEAQKNIVEAGGASPNIFGSKSNGASSASSEKSNLIPDKFNSMGVATSYFDPKVELDKEIQKEITKGPAEGAVGKITLAKESLKNIDDIEKLLFPTGEDSSFDRGIAARGNMPGLNVPFVGRITPRIMPDNPLDNNPVENSRAEKGQDYGRKIGASLSGRSLVQTGVSSRPDELQKLYEQFAPNGYSSPGAARKGLKELRSFYQDFLDNALPERRLAKKSETNDSSPFQVGQEYNGEKIKAVKRIK